MSKSTIIWLVIAGVLVVAGVVVFVVVMSINDWDFKKLGTVKYETNTYVIDDDFKKLIITVQSADIVFLPAEDGKCKVVCHEQEKVKHDVKVESDTLVVDAKDSRKLYDYIGFSFDTPRITVYLPTDKLNSLNINGSTGNIDIPKDFAFESIGISASTGDVRCYASASGEINIALSTGKIDISGISAGELKLSATTGDININDVVCDGKISTSVSTGDTTISATYCRGLTATSSTGDMELNNVVARGNFNLEATTGDIKFNSCAANEIYAKTSTGDIEGTLRSNMIFFAQTSTGNVDVPRSTTGGRCELETSTGDIEIDVVPTLYGTPLDD